MATKLMNHQELDTRRTYTVTTMKEQGHIITEFTCDYCPARFTCNVVFDAYNTLGECLRDKL